MTTRYYANDILPHITSAGAQALSTTGDLESRATFSAACVTLVAFAGCTLKVCIDLAGSCVKLSAVLGTPLGDLQLGSAQMCPDRPCIKLGGGLGPFKAELEACLVLSPLGVRLKATICAPFVGCKTVEVTIPLGFDDEQAAPGACPGCAKGGHG